MMSGARISTALLDAIRAQARAAPMVEVCGLLLGTADAITARIPARRRSVGARRRRRGP